MADLSNSGEVTYSVLQIGFSAIYLNGPWEGSELVLVPFSHDEVGVSSVNGGRKQQLAIFDASVLGSYAPVLEQLGPRSMDYDRSFSRE